MAPTDETEAALARVRLEELAEWWESGEPWTVEPLTPDALRGIALHIRAVLSESDFASDSCAGWRREFVRLATVCTAETPIDGGAALRTTDDAIHAINTLRDERRSLLARVERVERERDRLWELVHSVDTEMLREVSCCPSHNEDLHVMAAKFDAARGEARDGQ